MSGISMAASFTGWIFDGYESFALVVVIVPMLHSLLLARPF